MRVTRRAAALFVTVVLGTTACGQEALWTSNPQDVLFLQTPRGIAVVAAGASAPSFRARDAIPNRDWSAVVRVRLLRRDTAVIAERPATGEELWRTEIPGYWSVKVVAEDGSAAVLSPYGESPYTAGRRHTNWVVIGSDREPRYLTLEGNFEPEAFSTDGNSLFVLRYSPAKRPDRYQVRRLDLTTEHIGPVFTVDGHLQESMRGTARIQTMSPDGSRLYTLYTIKATDGQPPRAFVHVLNLDELWAHCIDLPEPFGDSAESANSITLSPSGDRLYVADSEWGEIAEVDTSDLLVARTIDATLGVGRETHSLYGADDQLYFAGGRKLVAIDALTGQPSGEWWLPGTIKGLQMGSDPRYLYVGMNNDQIAIFNTTQGRKIRTIDPGGVRSIGLLGRGTRLIQQQRSTFTCAC